jgi:hypothetical protein
VIERVYNTADRLKLCGMVTTVFPDILSLSVGVPSIKDRTCKENAQGITELGERYKEQKAAILCTQRNAPEPQQVVVSR